MAYVTKDIQKHASALGIGEEDKKKLFATTKRLNKFFEAVKEGESAYEIEDGIEREDTEDEMQQDYDEEEIEY